MPLNLEDPEIKAEIEALLDSRTKELKAHNERIISEKRKATEELQRVNKQFEGIDPDAIRKLLASSTQSEEEALLKSGKLDEVINRRLDPLRRDFEAKLAGEKETLAKEKAKAEAAEKRYKMSVIERKLTEQAVKAGVLATALPDILSRATGVFDIDEDGAIIARDRAGNLLMQDSKPYSPKHYIEELKEKAPHFWPGSKSGGLTGGGSSQSDNATQLASAAASGNMSRYRKLRDDMKKG